MRTFEEYLSLGVFYMLGTDSCGLDVDRMHKYAPELEEIYMQQIYDSILAAVDAGLIELDIDPNNLEVNYIVTEAGNKLIREQ